MSQQTERLGVAATELFFAKKGWLFREQFVHDWGIDAHVEIVRKGLPTGELIALQIKTGPSYFKGEDDDNVPFVTDAKHIRYWTGHSMPVVVVLYQPNTKQMYWQHITKETAISTGTRWKVLVPKTQSFDNAERTCWQLSAILQPEPYIRRLNKLRIDRRWMERIANGEQVIVEFDDWVNKSLPRYQITLSCDMEREALPTTYMPGFDVQGMLEHFLPWANVSMNEDAYFGHSEEYYIDDLPDLSGQIVPISENGETESYSLVLSLNELGKAFLVADDFFGEAPDDEPRTFTVDDL